MVFCFECGTKNNKKDDVCKKCGCPLIKPEYFGFPTLTDFNQLFTTENEKILNELSFNPNAYYKILENILNEAMLNYREIRSHISPEDYQRKSVYSKVSLIAMAFTKVEHKSLGDDLGHYAFNLIDVDDRLNKVFQATTLIHELTHHIVAEIFEQTLMYLLEVKKSEVLEAYVKFVLSDINLKLMNEYCAHRVEGRFVPHGYQGFGSFINIRNGNFDPNNEVHRRIVQEQTLFGNSLASDILRILEVFITPDLKEEIRNKYEDQSKFPPQYDQIGLEIYDELPQPVKVFWINMALSSKFEEAKSTGARDLLNYLKENFNSINHAKKGV